MKATPYAVRAPQADQLARSRTTSTHLAAAIALVLLAPAAGWATDLVRNGSMTPANAFAPIGWSTAAYSASELTNPLRFSALSKQSVTDAYGNTLTKDLMVLDTSATGYNGYARAFYQPLNLQPNTEYTLTFKARSQTTKPVDVFVQVRAATDFSRSDYTPAPTMLVTQRVRALGAALETYTVNFKTGATVNPGTPYYLAFAGQSFGGANGSDSGLIGITDVSLVDTPLTLPDSLFYAPGGDNSNPPKAKVSIHVNQVGYLGANKPFVFSVVGWPINSGWGFSAHLSRNGVRIKGIDGEQLMAEIISSKIDAETKLPVYLMRFDPANIPTNLLDDLVTTGRTTAPSPGEKQTGYQIEVYNPYVQTAGRTSIYSTPFAISKQIYNKLSADAFAYFGNNRAAINTSSISGNTYDQQGNPTTMRQAGHNISDKTAACRGGLDNFGNNFSYSSTIAAGCVVKSKDSNGNEVITPLSLDVTGGWYDAGDQGKYVVNGGVALWTLQNLIERLQKRADLTAAGTTKDALVSRVQNLMQQAKYEMDFFLKMQAPTGTWATIPKGYQGAKKSTTAGNAYGYYQTDYTGTTEKADTAAGDIAFKGGNLPRLAIKLALTQEDVSGMVFHAVHDANWTNIPTLPSNDNEARLLAYPTSAATLNFAAVAAQCARIWNWAKRPTGTLIPDTYSSTCLNAATLAWNAAKARHVDASGKLLGKDVFRYEYSNDDWSAVDSSGKNVSALKNGFALPPQFPGGGAYGDYRLKDEFYWAGMELYLARAQTATDTLAQDYLKFIQTEINSDSDKASGTWGKCSFRKVNAVGAYVNATGTVVAQKSSGLEVLDKDFPVGCYEWVNGFDWQNVAALGTLSALTADTARFPGAQNFVTSETPASTSSSKIVIKDAANATLVSYTQSPRWNLIQAATRLKSQTNGQSFAFAKEASGTPRETRYEWGSNGSVLNRAVILAVAADVTGDKSFADSAALSMDYILGRNANNVSYVTGYGSNAVRYPHHRHWAKLANPAYPQAQDGALVGGPNSRDIEAIFANSVHSAPGTIDANKDADNFYFINTVAAGCFNNINGTASVEVFNEQKCFADTHKSFATSEVAINWNAPLTWMTQYLYDYAQQ